MLNRIHLLPALLCSSVILLQSCYYDIESELYPGNGVCASTDITYNGRIEGIIANNCLSGCHSGPTPSASLDLSTYDLVKASALNGSLMSALRGTNGFSIMPQNTSGLSQCDISAVQDWINAGSANN